MCGKIMSLFCASYPRTDGGEVGGGGSFIIERGLCLVSRRESGGYSRLGRVRWGTWGNLTQGSPSAHEYLNISTTLTIHNTSINNGDGSNWLSLDST